ncbi:hypothetical protein RND71_017164 [Anisodus tanguticus]|uniref:Uncharacterized protein n=1 Tax=Anisodus tanguticus TaxID=243964 RepID=A0AAE1S398_9SOLA|nr:hypothetical protein RND71_017164 [Anisodus tanguticus]
MVVFCPFAFMADHGCAGGGYSWMQDNSASCEKLSTNGRKQGPLNAVSPTEQAQVSSVDDLYDFICSGPLINKIGLTPEKVAESIDKCMDRIGFSAPQGCGKTTLVFVLEYLSKMTGRKAATLSIDDFYLTAEEQAKLRDSNPGNLLLEVRGNAGIRDLPLSVETVTALSKLTKEGVKMKLPRYDKSAYNGRGDRADPSTWPEVEGPLPVGSCFYLEL